MSIRRRYLPDELLAKYRAIRNATSDEAFFRSPSHKKSQELWCAAHFARAYTASVADCAVWVADVDAQTDADFDLEVHDALYPFQITEVQEPGRRRGDEYKESAAPRETQRMEHWSSGSTAGPRWIRQSIEKKFERYAGNVSTLNLLIYLNFPAWDQRFDVVQAEATDIATKFASIWLLNGNALCCIAPSTALGHLSGWAVVPESLSYEEP